jgi:hypothetical protein
MYISQLFDNNRVKLGGGVAAVVTSEIWGGPITFKEKRQ